MTLYPIGIQDFEKVRNDGYAYVDKTRFIYQLSHTGCYYFLSRPRRFGKSLLLSAMKSYFLGRKDLFRGLDIERLETEWTEYPVLYLDINSGKYCEAGALKERLDSQLSLWEDTYGCKAAGRSFSIRFENVIRAAREKTGQRVVILVDEYDKPMLETIGDAALQADHRAELKAFYSVLKTMDGYIKFAFLTGVTKFGKVSVFSDLNNLMDISMDARYYDICGLTEEEIASRFKPGIEKLAAANSLTYDACLDRLRERYDGYHFETGTPGMYNPFSVLNTLATGTFKDYWFETGTPSFLVEVLKRSNYALVKMETRGVSTDILNCIDPLSVSPIPVIYQSGYLTIKSYDADNKLYHLDFPNGEVREGFLLYLLPFYMNCEKSDATYYCIEIRSAALSGEPERMLELMQELFDTGDYRVAGEAELYYQNAMYLIFRLLGLRAQVELATARGRMDIAVETKSHIYIIEVKLDGSPQEALRQIEAKNYAAKFAGDSRKLYKIGVNFSSTARSVDGWEIA